VDVSRSRRVSPTALRERLRAALALVATGGLVALAACGGMRPPVESPPPDGSVAAWAGTYRELSDWELTLQLGPDGRALIQTRWWGQTGSSLRRIPASWSLEGDGLALRYGEVIDHMRLDRAAAPDQGGKRRRLTALEPIDPRSLIGLSVLWADAGAP